jgi:hypothetical protein
MGIKVEIGPGDLADRLTILELKELHTPPSRRAVVSAQRASFNEAWLAAGGDAPDVANELAELRAINRALWAIEDEIRICETEGDFGPRFIDLARGVYINNDERARVKRKIDTLLGASPFDEKVYRTA